MPNSQPLYAAVKDLPKLDYTIAKQLPHRTDSFTQGLLVDGDSMVESSGLYGRSYVFRYHRQRGELLQRVNLPRNRFAEGIAQIRNTMYLLTWRSGDVFLFDAPVLEFRERRRISGEGWGLAAFNDLLVMSNGTAELCFLEVASWSVRDCITAVADGDRVEQLNDLTVVGNTIVANVWMQSYIVLIDAVSGRVFAYIDGAPLVEKEGDTHPIDGRANVLNGLAWDQQLNGLWVTGKRWRWRYLLNVKGLDTPDTVSAAKRPEVAQ